MGWGWPSHSVGLEPCREMHWHLGTLAAIWRDYFSRFKLNTVTSMSSLLSRYGIPEDLVSDTGPQDASQEFSTSSKEYNFCTLTLHCYAIYRLTPLTWCGFSLAELLMKYLFVRTSQWPYLDVFHQRNEQMKEYQKTYYDQQHGPSEQSQMIHQSR